MVQSKCVDRWPKNPKYQILLTDTPGGPIIMSGLTDIRRIIEPQYWIISASKKSTNPQDRITETVKESKSHIRTHKPLNAKIGIRTHKPLNAQNLYTNVHKSRTNYTKPHTLRKAVQKPYTYANDQTWVYKIITDQFLSTKT